MSGYILSFYKNPESEINKALNNYLVTIKNFNTYEEEIS